MYVCMYVILGANPQTLEAVYCFAFLSWGTSLFSGDELA